MFKGVFSCPQWHFFKYMKNVFRLAVWLNRGLRQDHRTSKEDLWYKEGASRDFYRACFSLARIKFLMANHVCHDIDTIVEAYIHDQFAKMR